MFKGFLAQQVKKFAVKHGDFTLASGKKSTYYIDLKQAYTRPEVMREIIFSIKENIKGMRFDRVAGMELGAVPIAVAVALTFEIPFVIVRKEKKGYGIAKRLEGEVLKDDNVLLVEDVATTGGSIAIAAEAIREAGGTCTKAIAVIDRLEGARESLQKINIELMPLLTIRDMGL